MIIAIMQFKLRKILKLPLQTNLIKRHLIYWLKRCLFNLFTHPRVTEYVFNADPVHLWLKYCFEKGDWLWRTVLLGYFVVWDVELLDGLLDVFVFVLVEGQLPGEHEEEYNPSGPYVNPMIISVIIDLRSHIINGTNLLISTERIHNLSPNLHIPLKTHPKINQSQPLNPTLRCSINHILRFNIPMYNFIRMTIRYNLNNFTKSFLRLILFITTI